MNRNSPASDSPQHIAIIMDGNNRWAKDRSLGGFAGHQAGSDRLKDIVKGCLEQRVRVLTVFAFSSENWCRSKREVGVLMSLFLSMLKRYRKELKAQNISLRVIGRRDRFSLRLQKLIAEAEKETAGGGYILNVAADYGGRWDIAEAAKAVAQQVKSGDLAIDDIDEATVGQHCQLADLPPVDLLIRTGAEQRISNFLLWQISYSELYFANCYWPDFDRNWLKKAIDDFKGRQRRYGSNPLADETGHENAGSPGSVFVPNRAKEAQRSESTQVTDSEAEDKNRSPQVRL